MDVEDKHSWLEWMCQDTGSVAGRLGLLGKEQNGGVTYLFAFTSIRAANGKPPVNEWEGALNVRDPCTTWAGEERGAETGTTEVKMKTSKAKCSRLDIRLLAYPATLVTPLHQARIQTYRLCYHRASIFRL